MPGHREMGSVKSWHGGEGELVVDLQIFRVHGGGSRHQVVQLPPCHAQMCVCVCVCNPIPFSKKWRKHGMDFICSGDKTVVAPPRSHQSPNGTLCKKKKGIVICKFLRKKGWRGYLRIGYRR